jgi:FemAB-related protein (PEP-CTERM system-associated)
MNAMTPFAMLTLSEAKLNQPDEAQRIDAWVRAQVGATPFHLTGWSRAVAKGCGQKPHYLVASDADGEIQGVLPLTAVRSRLFGNALASVGFAVSGGVLANRAEVADALVARMMELAESLKCPTVELRGGALPSGWHIDTDTYLVFIRDLADSDEAQLAAVPRKQRAEVRKALGFDLDLTIGREERDRAAHYAVYSESVRNLGTPVFPRALFDAVLDEFGDEADILTVWKDGVPLSSVLSLYFGGAVMPYWGGGVADARTWRANDLMYYALMNHARAAKGMARFDFGRSKAGTGPAAFKKNWGFEGQALSYAKRALDGSPPRDINPLSPKYRMQVALWQKLPLPVANLIGPLLARGLG